MPQNSIKALPLTQVDAATLGAAYTSLNAPGFAHPVVNLMVTNDSDKDLFISYDGVTDHDIVRAGGELFLFPQMGAIPNNKEAIFSKFTQVYGSCVGATGFIYIAAYYV